MASAGTSDAATAPTVPDEIPPEPEGILGGLQRSTVRRCTPISLDGVTKTAEGQQTWPVATNIDATNEALAKLFEGFAKETPQKPVAVISGGSLSGYSTALELADQGYQVVIAEKRKTYNRQNVLSLKTDTLLYWASLSPDGSLLRGMAQKRRVTPCTHELMAAPNTATGYAAKLNPSVRFLNWLIPPAALAPRIPVRARHADLQVRKQDLAGLSEVLPRQQNRPIIEALDLAWPANEPVDAVSPQDWQPPPAEFFGNDNMVFGQLCDLENALNEYCLTRASIHVVHATIELQQGPDEQNDYRPVFKFGDTDTAPTFIPDQAIPLICLAEGARSPNRQKVGGEIPPVLTNESWRQGNYVGQPSDRGGFNIVDVRPGTIIATQHIQQPHQSLVNISVFHPTDDIPSDATVLNHLHHAQAHVDTAAAVVNIAEENRVYDSGQIDICLRMARNPMHHNVIQIGDTAFSGSPAGGYGGSAAASQFSQLASDTVNHPLFNSSSVSDRQQVADFYRKRVADIRDMRTGRPARALRDLGVYSPQTYAANIRQAAAARFEGLGEIDVPPKNED